MSQDTNGLSISTGVTAALEIDFILSQPQLRRWHALDVERWLGPTRRFELGLSVRNRVVQEVTVIGLTAELLTREPFELRHLAGVAEMRYRLLVTDARQWRVSLERKHDFHDPDAVWIRDSRWIAVEYDAGGYSRERLEQKISGFRSIYGHGAQVWGCSSQARVPVVKRLLEPHGGAVFYAPWLEV